MARFELEAPSISTTDVGYLYEISTRLLFVTVEWVQSLEGFRQLAKSDQYNLLLNKWHSLFVLGMAQSSSMFPISTMLFLANLNSKETSQRPNKGAVNSSNHGASTPLPWPTFLKLKDAVLNGFISAFGRNNIDAFSYMKAATLFDAGKIFSI